MISSIPIDYSVDDGSEEWSHKSYLQSCKQQYVVPMPALLCAVTPSFSALLLSALLLSPAVCCCAAICCLLLCAAVSPFHETVSSKLKTVCQSDPRHHTVCEGPFPLPPFPFPFHLPLPLSLPLSLHTSLSLLSLILTQHPNTHSQHQHVSQSIVIYNSQSSSASTAVKCHFGVLEYHLIAALIWWLSHPLLSPRS